MLGGLQLSLPVREFAERLIQSRHKRVMRLGERWSELPDAELPYDDGNERLRRAHLQNGQAKATALFAPYFALVLVPGWSTRP